VTSSNLEPTTGRKKMRRHVEDEVGVGPSWRR